MTEEVQAAEAEAEQAEAQEAEPNEAETKQPDPEVEARARTMGWAPQDEFRGDPERWVDAETFVKRGDEVMPILRANNRKLESRVAELEQTLQDFAAHHTKTERRMYEKALKDLRAQQRKAAEAGDIEAYDAIEKQAEGIVKEATTSLNGSGQNGKGPDIDPVAQQWAQDNRWFREDKAMGAWAATHHEFLLNTKPGLTLEENLQEVTKAVKKAFPEKFSNPKRNDPSPVEGGSTPKTKGGKGYDDLPADAKAACDRFVKQGIMKKEDYLKEFFAE